MSQRHQQTDCDIHGRITSPRKDVHVKETHTLSELDRDKNQRYGSPVL